MNLRRVFMHFIIFPSISEVTLAIIKADQSSLINQSETLRWLAIVLMNFRQPFRKAVGLVINWMRKRKLDKIEFRKNFFHFFPNECIESIVIRDVKESTADKIVPQIFCFL